MNTLWKKQLEQDGAVFNRDTLIGFSNHPSSNDCALKMADLSYLGIIRISGADATSFLQGQFTNDVTLLNDNHSHLSGLCNAKGRLITLARMWKVNDDIYLSLPKTQIETIIKRLRLYVLRAKVQLEDVSDEIVLLGLQYDASLREPADFDSLPKNENEALQKEGLSFIRLSGDTVRYQVAGKSEEVINFWQEYNQQSCLLTHRQWQLTNIEAGEPMITDEVSESFVPQMINLDLLDGISFNKGCYTGQEIVARTQYLGKLKRRLYLAEINTTEIKAGDSIYVADNEQAQGEIVNAIAINESTSRVLFVSRIDAVAQHPLHLGKQDGAELKLLDMPYTVPLDSG